VLAVAAVDRVWFDDIGISAFHSYVVTDLWQSLSEWHLLLYECVLVCCRENIKFLVKLGKSGSEIRETLVQGISAFHSCVVVELWQSLSEWCLLLHECVSVCRCKNVGA
jgi:hypothetical protein